MPQSWQAKSQLLFEMSQHWVFFREKTWPCTSNENTTLSNHLAFRLSGFWRKLIYTLGMSEAGGKGGSCPPPLRFWRIRRRRRQRPAASRLSTCPPQIFRLCDMLVLCMVSWRLWNFQASHQLRIQIRVWVLTLRVRIFFLQKKKKFVGSGIHVLTIFFGNTYP